MSIPVFLTLMSSFLAHLKIKASQWFALRRIKQMEQQAAEEDEAENSNSTNVEIGKNRRRAVNWEMEITEGLYN
jgi:hypothetical protein